MQAQIYILRKSLLYLATILSILFTTSDFAVAENKERVAPKITIGNGIDYQKGQIDTEALDAILLSRLADVSKEIAINASKKIFQEEGTSIQLLASDMLSGIGILRGLPLANRLIADMAVLYLTHLESNRLALELFCNRSPDPRFVPKNDHKARAKDLTGLYTAYVSWLLGSNFTDTYKRKSTTELLENLFVKHVQIMEREYPEQCRFVEQKDLFAALPFEKFKTLRILLRDLAFLSVVSSITNLEQEIDRHISPIYGYKTDIERFTTSSNEAERLTRFLEQKIDDLNFRIETTSSSIVSITRQIAQIADEQKEIRQIAAGTANTVTFSTLEIHNEISTISHLLNDSKVHSLLPGILTDAKYELNSLQRLLSSAISATSPSDLQQQLFLNKLVFATAQFENASVELQDQYWSSWVVAMPDLAEELSQIGSSLQLFIRNLEKYIRHLSQLIAFHDAIKVRSRELTLKNIELTAKNIQLATLAAERDTLQSKITGLLSDDVGTSSDSINWIRKQYDLSDKETTMEGLLKEALAKNQRIENANNKHKANVLKSLRWIKNNWGLTTPLVHSKFRSHLDNPPKSQFHGTVYPIPKGHRIWAINRLYQMASHDPENIFNNIILELRQEQLFSTVLDSTASRKIVASIVNIVDFMTISQDDSGSIGIDLESYLLNFYRSNQTERRFNLYLSIGAGGFLLSKRQNDEYGNFAAIYGEKIGVKMRYFDLGSCCYMHGSAYISGLLYQLSVRNNPDHPLASSMLAAIDPIGISFNELIELNVSTFASIPFDGRNSRQGIGLTLTIPLWDYLQGLR